MTDIPHDHLGHPDLQALVRQCGGFDKILLRVGSLHGAAVIISGP